MSVLLIRTKPPGCTFGSNFSSDGRFIATSTLGWLTTGEPMRRSDTTTEQLAVPPRISGPYDGIQETSLPSSIPASAIIFPRKRIPWPPKPASVIS